MAGGVALICVAIPGMAQGVPEERPLSEVESREISGKAFRGLHALDPRRAWEATGSVVKFSKRAHGLVQSDVLKVATAEHYRTYEGGGEGIGDAYAKAGSQRTAHRATSPGSYANCSPSASQWTCSTRTRTSPGAPPHTTKATDVVTPARKPSP